MHFVVVLIAGWFADWLVSHVAGLDPATARQVAEVLVDHIFGVAVTLVATGWYWLKRPGDIPAKSLPAVAVFQKPTYPADAGERK